MSKLVNQPRKRRQHVKSKRHRRDQANGHGGKFRSGSHRLSRHTITVKPVEWWVVECQLAEALLKLGREGLMAAKEIEALKSSLEAGA